MTIKHISTVLLASGALLAGGLVAAPSASATTLDGCGSFVYFIPVDSQVTVDFTNCPTDATSNPWVVGGGDWNLFGAVAPSIGFDSGYQTPTATATLNGPGSIANLYIIQTRGQAPFWNGDLEWDVFLLPCGQDISAWQTEMNDPDLDSYLLNEAVTVSLCGSDASGGSDALGRAEILQQVGLPASGTCDITNTSHNWGGAPSGGWSRSWAEWAIPTTGGGVCTRTLYFDSGLGHYSVR